MSSPIAVATQRPAAVVRPMTSFPVVRMTPAAMKPMPWTTVEAMRPGSEMPPARDDLLAEQDGADHEERRALGDQHVGANAGRFVGALALEAEQRRRPPWPAPAAGWLRGRSAIPSHARPERRGSAAKAGWLRSTR